MDRPEVLALFARQHWVAGVAQLHELNVGRDVIYLARRKGLVTSPVRGVLAVADVELSFRGRAMAALLAAAGHEAFVSGPSAGVIHGLRNMPRVPVEISVREDRRVTLPPWARLVRTSWIVDERDVVELPDGLRVATPLRTLFGLARRFNQHRFERAAEDLWHRRLITPEDAASYLTAVRQQGKTGVARFEEWLQRALPRERPSQSGLELDFVDLIARLGTADTGAPVPVGPAERRAHPPRSRLAGRQAGGRTGTHVVARRRPPHDGRHGPRPCMRPDRVAGPPVHAGRPARSGDRPAAGCDLPPAPRTLES